MSRYTVEVTTSAQKELRRLDSLVRKRVVRAIAELAEEPRPVGCKKLKARDGYRVRIGDHRVIYTIDDGRVTVVVIKVGPRGDVYDR
ncbi:type II toxin-antitoxin system RelE family toxin [Nocardiopsis changdeensis]|uniref:Type II toxin-antitoxin system RelE/ParE family toxin n=1 Tax=Nocardiopsis changdeensis TaxID=2831969 RepID=A0ABX8BG19_9ACTN|nr:MULTISPECIES: type II toxin-antitoxin system RelE/ParE family toxin [Nocardiopsis]QUX21086.1 type II toxin-antitoxin system RelE/ParE family toxin [Nocardiopsis changdeensis]QYX37016.1 type II toxin-antitoxin system RelE/ParE family toxin [Nocardiopsis sp. MT53]